MHAVELLAAALSLDVAPPPDVSAHVTPDETCCVTGLRSVCLPRRRVLTRSFTAQGEFRAPLSPWISVAATRVLSYRPARTSSWWCDGETFLPLRRADVRARVIAPRDTCHPWAGYVTTSYKKHGSLLAPVNAPGQHLWLFETRRTNCAPTLVAEIWPRLRAMQDAGWSRAVLESLTPPAWLLRHLGPRDWISFETWARPRCQGSTYQFLCYLLPSVEERRAAGTLPGSDTPTASVMTPRNEQRALL